MGGGYIKLVAKSNIGEGVHANSDITSKKYSLLGFGHRGSS